MTETLRFSINDFDNDKHQRRHGANKEKHRKIKYAKMKQGFRAYKDSGAQEGDYVQVESRFGGQPIGTTEGIVMEHTDRSGKLVEISVGDRRIRLHNLDSIKLLK